MISMVTADVRPFSCSCRWRRTKLRAAPRPSSSPELERTPIKVDFPLVHDLLMIRNIDNAGKRRVSKVRGAASETNALFARMSTPGCNKSTLKHRRKLTKKSLGVINKCLRAHSATSLLRSNTRLSSCGSLRTGTQKFGYKSPVDVAYHGNTNVDAAGLWRLENVRRHSDNARRVRAPTAACCSCCCCWRWARRCCCLG